MVVVVNLFVERTGTADKYTYRSRGLMDKALVFGTKDCRFESCRDHFYYTRGSGLAGKCIINDDRYQTHSCNT